MPDVYKRQLLNNVSMLEILRSLSETAEYFFKMNFRKRGICEFLFPSGLYSM